MPGDRLPTDWLPEPGDDGFRVTHASSSPHGGVTLPYDGLDRRRPTSSRFRRIMVTVLPFSTFIAAGLVTAWALPHSRHTVWWWLATFAAGLVVATVVRWVADRGLPAVADEQPSDGSTLDGAVAGMACALFLVIGFLLLPQSFEVRNRPTLTGVATADAVLRAVDDLVSGSPGQPMEIRVLDNDTGAIEPATLTLPTAVAGASITKQHTIAYTPTAQTTGVTTFAYKVCDAAKANCAQAEVRVKIGG